MPTRKRRAREREIAAERAAVAAQFNVPMPAHVIERLGRPSKLLKALSTNGTKYAWNGLRVDDEADAALLIRMPDDLGANVERAEEATRRAQEMRRKAIETYGAQWNVRGGAKRIAADQWLSLSTVYAHMARLRRS